MTSPDAPLILIVDDTPANLTAMEALLSDRGYRLKMARSGIEALKLVLEEVPALILLDVMMPEMDGYEVAHHLKQVARSRDVPIIFLTGLATDAKFTYRAFEAGAVDYLVKPVEPELIRRKVAVFLDMARRVRQADVAHAEEVAELRDAADRRYRKLVEGIPQTFGWTAGSDFHLTFVSRQAPELLGHSTETFFAPDFWKKHVHPDDLAALLAAFRAAITEHGEQIVTHRLQSAGGELTWFRTCVSADPGSAHSGAVLNGISMDVTDVKRAQLDAERGVRLREELLAIVSHDLRTPLTALRLGASLVKRHATRTHHAQLDRSAETIGRAVTRMSTLVDNLLDFVVINSGTTDTVRTSVSVERLIQEALELLTPLANERGLVLESRVKPNLNVDGQYEHLLRVLTNLVGNAIKFTPPGGTITVRAEAAGEHVEFVVQDTGEGISAAEAERITARDWKPRLRPEGGVGLGLYISQGLVGAHGGRLWVEKLEGPGTTFKFTIPSRDVDH